jgi:hypothetical protein
MAKLKYDSTVARIAGNIAGSFISNGESRHSTQEIAVKAVRLARAIVERVIETEPDELKAEAVSTLLADPRCHDIQLGAGHRCQLATGHYGAHSNGSKLWD